MRPLCLSVHHRAPAGPEELESPRIPTDDLATEPTRRAGRQRTGRHVVVRRKAQIAAWTRCNGRGGIGNSVRTAPSTSIRPDAGTRATGIGPNHRLSALITTSSSCGHRFAVDPRSLTDVRGRKAPGRADRLPGDDSRVEAARAQARQRLPAPGEFRLHQQQASPAGQQLRRRLAQCIHNQAAVVAGIPRPRSPTSAGSARPACRAPSARRAGCRPPSRRVRTLTPA